jgi:hypothetical protein
MSGGLRAWAERHAWAEGRPAAQREEEGERQREGGKESAQASARWVGGAEGRGSDGTGSGNDAVEVEMRAQQARELARHELEAGRGDGGDGLGRDEGRGEAASQRLSGWQNGEIGAQTHGWHEHQFLSRDVGGGGERGREFSGATSRAPVVTDGPGAGAAGLNGEDYADADSDTGV